MASSLTSGATVVTLPDDMAWPNEFTWKAVQQKSQYSITGSLLVETALKVTGRPIELKGGDGFAWITRTNVISLYALAQLSGTAMALVVRGASFNVVFDHEAGAMEAAPVVEYGDPDDADWYVVTLRFLEVPV